MPTRKPHDRKIKVKGTTLTRIVKVKRASVKACRKRPTKRK